MAILQSLWYLLGRHLCTEDCVLSQSRHCSLLFPNTSGNEQSFLEVCSSLTLVPRGLKTTRVKNIGKGQEGTKEQKSDVLVFKTVSPTPTPVIPSFINLPSMSLMTCTLVQKWQKNPREKLDSFNHYCFYYTRLCLPHNGLWKATGAQAGNVTAATQW